jgi:N-acetylneuraminic acid mutarotase
MKLLLSCLLAISAGAQTWTRLPDFPGAGRDDGIAVWCAGRVISGTGAAPSGVTADFYQLDPTQQQWTTSAPLVQGKERQYAAAFVDENTFYLVGGEQNATTPLNDHLMYDVYYGAWLSLSDHPSPGLYGAAAFRIDDKFYLAGGKTTAGALSSKVWQYDLSTHAWSQKQDLPFPSLFRASACGYNGSGYLIFGMQQGDKYSSKFYRYDPASDTWSQLPSLNSVGRAYSSLNMLDGKLCVVGGNDSAYHFYNDTWFFDTSDSTWTAGPSLPGTARRGGMTCSSGHDLYYVCGLLEGNLRTQECWQLRGIFSSVVKEEIGVLRLKPNPVQNTLYIVGAIIPGTVSISSAQGCLLYKGFVENDSLDVSWLSPGVYILEREDREGNVTRSRFIRN